MKTKLNILIYLIVAALTLVSCKKDTLDPLSGKYTPPEVMDLTVLDSQIREKAGSLFVFSINLKDEASNTLNLKFVAADYTLPASDFTASGTAANKTYLIGNDGSTCNGQQISSGTISVALAGSNYTIQGIIHLADGTVVKMTGAFSVVYEYIPIYTYSETKETPAMGGAYGNVAIAGTTKHKITVYSDGVKSGYFEVVTSDAATSLSGTYPVKSSLDAAGKAGQGFYLDWAWYGGSGILDGGCYYVKNSEKKYIRPGGGDISIVDDGSSITITGTNLKIMDLATLISSNGATTQNLADPGSVNIENATAALTNLFSATATDLSGYGLNYYSTALKICTGGVTATYNSNTWSWEYTGNGNVISIEFKRSDATLPAGIYNVVNNATAVIGNCVAGYPNPYGGSDIWGSVWSTVTNGIITGTVINSGIVEIIANGSNYTIIVDVTTNSGAVKTTYSGPITFAK